MNIQTSIKNLKEEIQNSPFKNYAFFFALGHSIAKTYMTVPTEISYPIQLVGQLSGAIIVHEAILKNHDNKENNLNSLKDKTFNSASFLAIGLGLNIANIALGGSINPISYLGGVLATAGTLGLVNSADEFLLNGKTQKPKM